MPLTLPALSGPEWCVTVDAFHRERVAGEETMFTLANGGDEPDDHRDEDSEESEGDR